MVLVLAGGPKPGDDRVAGRYPSPRIELLCEQRRERRRRSDLADELDRPQERVDLHVAGEHVVEDPRVIGGVGRAEPDRAARGRAEIRGGDRHRGRPGLPEAVLPEVHRREGNLEVGRR